MEQRLNKQENNHRSLLEQMMKLQQDFKVLYLYRAQGHLARESFARKIFKLYSWSPEAGFFHIGTIN